MKSCINCSSRQFDTQWITCECMNATGSWFISSLDLSEFFMFLYHFTSASQSGG